MVRYDLNYSPVEAEGGEDDVRDGALEYDMNGNPVRSSGEVVDLFRNVEYDFWGSRRE